jgi:hypothetical protein
VNGFMILALWAWLLPIHSCPPVAISALVILYFLKGSFNVSRHDAD